MLLCFSGTGQVSKSHSYLGGGGMPCGWHTMLLSWGALVPVCPRGPITPAPGSICPAWLSVSCPANAACRVFISLLVSHQSQGSLRLAMALPAGGDYSGGLSPGHDLPVSVVPPLWMLCSFRIGIEDTCVSVCFFSCMPALCTGVLREPAS